MIGKHDKQVKALIMALKLSLATYGKHDPQTKTMRVKLHQAMTSTQGTEGSYASSPLPMVQKSFQFQRGVKRSLRISEPNHL